jgi:hypothetical protein
MAETLLFTLLHPGNFHEAAIVVYRVSKTRTMMSGPGSASLSQNNDGGRSSFLKERNINTSYKTAIW